MPVKVLIVDDSRFFRQNISNLLSKCNDIQVIAAASDGIDAIEKVEKYQPDIITMDYEMPRMDGITAVRKIMEKNPTPIIMFSSLTYEGARTTLDAIDAGAVDYLPKNMSAISCEPNKVVALLRERILRLAKKKPKQIANRDTENIRLREQLKEPSKGKKLLKKNPRLIVIGASTGGPAAIQNLIVNLPTGFSVPILIVQHMPATFTGEFANRLNTLCNLEVREAKDGDQLLPGVALVAKGGMHMMLTKKITPRIKLIKGECALQYRPSVDVTFGSAAKVYQSDVLAIVLTGMGSDGCEGARLLKQEHSVVWTQEKDNCLISGMPVAVQAENLSDAELTLSEISRHLVNEIRH